MDRWVGANIGLSDAGMPALMMWDCKAGICQVRVGKVLSPVGIVPSLSIAGAAIDRFRTEVQPVPVRSRTACGAGGSSGGVSASLG